MKKDAFIIYSPLHAYIVDSLVGYYDMKNVDVYMSKMFDFKFTNKVNIIKIYHGGSQVNKYKKLVFFIFNTILFRKRKYDSLFIANDADPFTMYFEKLFEYKELNYIDEGCSYLSKVQFKLNESGYGSRSDILKKIFKLDSHNVCLSSDKIKNAYVFFPNELEKLNSKPIYNDLKNYIFTTNHNVNIDEKFKNPDILILTQPLTEDSHCTNYQEVKVIESVIKNNLDKKIVIRLHYRDDIKKYEQFTSYQNVLIMNELLDFPYQILHTEINPKNIYSFISSILFSSEPTNIDFKRVSMIDKIDSVRAKNYKVIFNQLHDYFDDFYFLEDLEK